MTYDEINPNFREMLGAFEVFRKLGFTPDEIQVARNPNGELFVVLLAQGKQFAITCGVTDMTDATFEREWIRTATMWNEGLPEEVRTRIYLNCKAFTHKTDLLMAMLSKGITFRR